MSLTNEVDTPTDIGQARDRASDISATAPPNRSDQAKKSNPTSMARRLRRLERQLVDARVETLRLRADLEVARARSGQRPLAIASSDDRRAAEEAADRLADQVDAISPVSATRIREESGSNTRLRLEGVARATQDQLDAAHGQADRIQRRARAHARKIISDGRSAASAEGPQVFEMVALQAENDAVNLHEAAMDERDALIGTAVNLADAESTAVREEAQLAAERIVGQAHNRSSSIIADAKARAEIIIAGALHAAQALEDVSAKEAAAVHDSDDNSDDEAAIEAPTADTGTDAGDDPPGGSTTPALIQLTEASATDDTAPANTTKRANDSKRRWRRSRSAGPATSSVEAPKATTALDDEIDVTDEDAANDFEGWEKISLDDDTEPDLVAESEPGQQPLDEVVDVVDLPAEVSVEKTFAALWTKPSDDIEQGLKQFFGETDDTSDTADAVVDAPF